MKRLINSFVISLLIIFLSLSATAREMTPPSGFCQAKTNYTPGVTCSEQVFVARNKTELNSYLGDFGLENGQYKNLRINFAIDERGEKTPLVVNSPCRIDIVGERFHRVQGMCLDGREGVIIGKNSGISSNGSINIFSLEGDTIIERGTNMRNNMHDFVVFSSGEVRINKGVSIEANIASISSTSTNPDTTDIRFGPGSSVFGSNTLEVFSKGRINLLSRARLKSGNLLNIETIGSASLNTISIAPQANLSGTSLRLRSGHQIQIKRNAIFSFSENYHIEAPGCRIHRDLVFTANSKSGNCLGEDNFNRPPKASFTASARSGTVPFRVTFDASASSDDNEIVEYRWSFSDGGNDLFGSSVERTFTTLEEHTVTLSVKDSDDIYDEASTRVYPFDTSRSPIAHPVVTPTRGPAPLTVQLDGSTSTDRDGGTIESYVWNFSDGEAALRGSTNTRTYDIAGNYSLYLSVFDNDGLPYASDDILIEVLENTLPPIMTGNQDFDFTAQPPFNFTLNGATDPEGGSLTYSIVVAPTSGTLEGCLDGTDDLTCTFTPEQDFTGAVSFSYKANDGRRDSEGVSVVTLNILSQRRPVADAGADQDVKSGAIVTLDGSGSSDPEGADLTYSWRVFSRPMMSNTQLANPNSISPSIIVDRDGVYILELVVNDGVIDSTPDTVEVRVTGAVNTAPTLNTIASPRTLQVGQEIRFTISGSESDPDDQLFFTATNLPENSRLDGNSGEFRFIPVMSQVGSHTITFMATDGKDSVSQDVVVTVEAPAAGQLTTLSSRVLDGNAMSEGRTIPIAGVRITVEGSNKVATSDAQGYFTLTDIPHGVLAVNLDASGITNPDGDSYANFKGKLRIMENVLNRPHRDYMLPKIDSSSIATIVPTQATTVQNETLGVSMTIPPQTAVNIADGTMYSGPISISMVPVDSAPRELPEEFGPSMLITFQPIGVRFNNPVPITFPNNDGLVPGALVDIISLSEEGGFEVSGIGRVSSDGATITTVKGGIRSTTWHMALPVAPRLLSASTGLDSGGGCGIGSFGSSICPSTGTVMEEHIFPSFTDSGETIEHRMYYKDTPQNMAPAIVAKYVYDNVVSDGVDPTVLPVSTQRMSVSMGGVTTDGPYFNTSAVLGAASPLFLSQKLVGVEFMQTGVTNIGIESASFAGESRRLTRDSVALTFVAPETNFGMGWMFPDIHRLYGVDGVLDRNVDSIMLVHGNFEHWVYEKNPDGTYTSPKGDYSTFRTVPLPVGGFTRTTKSGDEYVFNGSGFMISKKDRYNRSTAYNYTLDGKLSTIVHPSGRVTTFAYGLDGYLDSVTDPTGRITRFEHDTDGNLIKITDPDNSEKRFEYGEDHSLIAQVSKRGYVTNYGKDPQNNLSRAIRPDNSSVSLTPSFKVITLDDLARGTLENPFDVGTEEDEDDPGVYTDSLGNITEFETNGFGSPTTISTPLEGRTGYFRDENNNITLINRHHFTASIFYDSMGNVINVFDAGLEGASHSRTYQYLDNPADNFHQPTVENVGGSITSYRYDSYGNIIGILDPEGNSTSMTYTKKYLLDSLRDINNHAGSFYQYDSNDNLIRVRDAAEDTLIAFTYDTAGNILTQTDALGNTTTYTYDSMNRLLTQTDAKGGVVTYAYDSAGNTSSVTDQLGKRTTFSYDSMNRLTERIDPLGRRESFSYDLNGNLVSRVDKNGQTITYEYDAANRMTSKSSGGRRTTFTYDNISRLTSAETPDSKLSFDLGSGHNLLEVVSTGDSPSQPNISIYYKYDSRSNVTNVLDTEPSSPLLVYAFDGNDRLTSVAQNTIGYDSYLRRISTNYANGTKSTYSYVSRKAAQVRSIKHALGTREISSFNYNYNSNDLVTAAEASRSGIAVNSPINYLYDTINQVTSATKKLESGNESLVYDLVGNRLRSGSETADSTFNNNHQLINDKKFSYTYDNNGNLIKRVNLSTNEVMELTWDYENQLTQVVKRPSEGATPTGTFSYKYDAFGGRIQKNINGEITSYIYDRDNILLEYDGDDNLKAKYTHNRSVTDDVLVMERDDTPYRNEAYPKQEFYFHKDRLGNITEVTDHAGIVVQRYVYDAFGAITIFDKDGNQITADSPTYLKNPYTFTGREYDPETGFYYYRARYYDPNTGRFLNEDPIGLDGGTHFYAYTGNNPINRVDPFGLDWRYHQGSGIIYRVVNGARVPGTTHSGYSGAPGYVNDPSSENLKSRGVIPKGTYRIGTPENTKKLRFALRLTPISGNLFGRVDFFIHGEREGARPRTSSEGCIILPPNFRRQIANSGDNILVVVR